MKKPNPGITLSLKEELLRSTALTSVRRSAMADALRRSNDLISVPRTDMLNALHRSIGLIKEKGK